LLFYAIPVEATVEGFEPGILLFVIIGTSLVMTGGMIRDKKLNPQPETDTIEENREGETEYFINNTTDLSELDYEDPTDQTE